MPPWLMTDRPTEDQGRLGDPPGAKSQGGFDCRWGAHARCIGVADDTPPELARGSPHRRKMAGRWRAVYGNGVGRIRPGPHCSLDVTSPHRDVLLLTYLLTYGAVPACLIALP